LRPLPQHIEAVDGWAQGNRLQSQSMRL
jgi:hypothetical protein